MTRWILVTAFLVVTLGGCGDSEDTVATESTVTTTTTTTTETTPRTTPKRPPRSYDELMARLPPFDEPASDEVTAYRKATIGAFFERCLPGTGGANKASFVAANRKALAIGKPFKGAAFLSEYSIDQRDGNGCLEGTGPPTYYTTYRTYRLPPGTSADAVLDYYQHEYRLWLASASTSCERTFGQGPAFVYVSACAGILRLSARGRAPVELPAPPPPPPRPYGAQYPIAPDSGAVEPTSHESDPGLTCERMPGADVPSIIVPPPPGVRAWIDDSPFELGAAKFKGSVVVEWSLGTVHGDCPPSELILSYPTTTAYTIHEPVHTRSGVTRMPLVDVGPRPTVLRATAVSVDGHYSRQVAVLLR